MPKNEGHERVALISNHLMKLLLIFLQKLPRLLYLIVRCINNLVCALQPHSLRNLLCLGCLIL